MKRKIYTYLHSHWDREWYKSFERFRHRLVEVLDDIFQKLDNGEISSFYFDGQTIALNDYLEINPEKKNYIKQLIKEKKIFVGPFWVLADEYLVSGTSLLKNLYYGLKYSKEFGEEFFIGYLPDAFGHNSMMPQILSLSNIDKAIVWRGVNIQDNIFYWQNNISKILCSFLAFGYYQDYFTRNYSYKKLSEILKPMLDKLSKISKSAPMLLPIGADHLGTPNKLNNIFKGINKYLDDYEFVQSDLSEYFSKIKTSNITIEGELKNNENSCILPSVASSRIYLKQKNMYSTWFLSKIVEPLISILTFNNLVKNYQNEFDYAWKLLLQNHAHDSICGCSVDEAHKESLVRNLKVDELNKEILNSAIFRIEKKVSKNEIFIANLSNYTYSGVIKLLSSRKLPYQITNRFKKFPESITADIKNIPVQENYKYVNEYLIPVENIKGLSLSTVKLPELNKSDIKITEKVLENSLIKLEINNDGSINIKDKLTNKEFNNIHRFVDESDVGDSYNFSPILNDVPIYSKFVSSKIFEKGFSRATIQLKYEINIPKTSNEFYRSKKYTKTIISTNISIYQHSGRIDFKTVWNNASKNHRLKINFNLPNNIEKIISENSFGSIERTYNPEYNYKSFLPVQKGIELDLNTNSFQRFVSSQGICILTKGLQEYEIYKNNLNLIVLRSFGIIAKKTLSSRGFAAGPPIETPDGQMFGECVAEYAVCLTDNQDEMFKQADFYYNPVICFEGKSKKTDLKNIEFLNLPENLQIQSLNYDFDKKGLVVSIFNNSNKKINVKINYKYVYETDLTLKHVRVKDNTVEFLPKSLKMLFITNEDKF